MQKYFPLNPCTFPNITIIIIIIYKDQELFFSSVRTLFRHAETKSLARALMWQLRTFSGALTLSNQTMTLRIFQQYSKTLVVMIIPMFLTKNTGSLSSTPKLTELESLVMTKAIFFQ